MGKNQSTSLLQPLFQPSSHIFVTVYRPTCPAPGQTTEIGRHFVRHQLYAIGLVK